MECKYCGSYATKRNGTRRTSLGFVQEYKCNDCGRAFREDFSPEVDRFTPSVILKGQKFVITCIQNNVPTNHEFLGALELYCNMHGAKLLVVPLEYQRNLYSHLDYDVDRSYLIETKVSLNGLVNVLSSVKLGVTAENPLGGLDSLTKGKSLIVPHNQMQMRSLPVHPSKPPVLLHTTGTISAPQYTNTKAGEKALFNHSNAAVVVEFDNAGSYHVRVLNCDESDGFYDIDGYYNAEVFVELDGVEAIIMGDEHAFVNSEEVRNATYFNDDSIVNTLKPNAIVRHDVLDCFTVSHHHRRDKMLEYSKFSKGMNKITDELEETLQYLENTTPDGVTSYIVSSNHHDHLNRWLNEAKPKEEPWNAKFYHKLSYLMMEAIDEAPSIHVPDAFALYAKSEGCKSIFVGRDNPLTICGIELSNHGDVGANGSKGSIGQFGKFSDKLVVGHSHSPGINKGAYQVGTSTPKKLEYTKGHSSWMNTHCVIYRNGKRQLISIINGKWKA